MTTHQILNSNDHANLRIRTHASEGLGDAIMSSMVMPIEFRQVQAHYPIVFRMNTETGLFTAHALFGFDAGENLFLVEDRWDARYRPLAIAVQPFLIGRGPDGEASQVHIDAASPRISKDDGIRLFDEGGQPTPYLEEISDLLGTLDTGLRTSGAFFEALQRYDLLEPFTLDIPLEDGSKNRLVGFHAINEDRLTRLDAQALAELHAADHLLPIFMALASLTRIGDLVERKNQRQSHG